MQVIEIDERCEDFTINYHDMYNLETLEECDMDYESFFKKFMRKNLPCIIRNVSRSWECTTKWTTVDGINSEYFKEQYGDLEAPVAVCDRITFNAHCKINMKVLDYMKYINNNQREKLLYLKDWHLKRLRPNDSFYEVPIIFASDWLNEFAIDHEDDDFMFVYIGPQKSWTPLHADVYSSYSWSVNVVGRKKWILFPPGEEDKLKDTLGNLPIVFSSEKFENVKYFEVIQERGDAIFVPSGWYHQVTNLLDTISINHNWINACNIESVWKALNNNLLSVENEIKEFKATPEFSSQCQLILKSVFGMDFSDFVHFVCYIGNKRLAQLQGDKDKGFSNFRIGINHIKFDLCSLLKVMNLIHNHPLFINKLLSQNIESDFVNTKNNISALIPL